MDTKSNRMTVMFLGEKAEKEVEGGTRPGN